MLSIISNQDTESNRSKRHLGRLRLPALPKCLLLRLLSACDNQAMIARRAYHGLTWIDFDNPEPAELSAVIREFDIDPSAAQELLNPSPRSKTELYGHFIYGVFHFPFSRRTARKPYLEIDFIVGRHFIITSHYEDHNPLHEFGKVFEVNSLLDKNEIGDHAGYIFFYMMKRLYHAQSSHMDHIESELESIEDNIFHEREKEMVVTLSKASRELLDIKKTMSFHKETLASFAKGGIALFGDGFATYLDTLAEDSAKINLAVKINQDFVRELRDTNNSLLSTKQNEIMKFFTVISFVTFPLALIVQILGFNSPHNPILGKPNDFWIIIGILGIVCALMFLFFKRRRWI